jgi:hypothetical protein
VETNFVSRHPRQLNALWRVKKNETDFNLLRFNTSYNNPLIEKEGWIEFIEYHHLPENVTVLLRYHGNNLFDLAHFEEITSEQTIPSFHSRSMIYGYTDYFDIELTDMKIDVPKLVSSKFRFYLL